MTAKRFTSQRTEDYNFSDILDNGKWIGICHIDCEDDFVNKFNELAEENEQLKEQINELKEDVPLLLAFYRWYPFAVEKKEHQSYNRLWDFVND